MVPPFDSPELAVPARSSGTYQNPILDHDFPDPAVIHAADGFYYAYATQTERNGGWINIQVARSADLINWVHLGDALPEKPSWAKGTQDFWAPSVVYDSSNYLMYYSATPDIVRRSGERPLPGGRDGRVARRAIRRHGNAAAARNGLRIYRSDGLRRPGQREALPLLGIWLSADQSAAAGRRPEVVRARDRADQHRLAQSDRRRLPEAGRSGVGHSPRRFLLLVLLGR